MKVINIPAYSYFDGNHGVVCCSRSDINELFDKKYGKTKEEDEQVKVSFFECNVCIDPQIGQIYKILSKSSLPLKFLHPRAFPKGLPPPFFPQKSLVDFEFLFECQ